jgi:hypothetical protein
MVKRIAIGGLVIVAFLIAYGWRQMREISPPTTNEYAVYSAFLQHLSSNKLYEGKKLVVTKQTPALRLLEYGSLPPNGSAPTPPGLRITKIDDLAFADFSDFCGSCAKDFVRKNSISWPLHNNAAFQVAPERRDEEPYGETGFRQIMLSRVGFNLWHDRAVLRFNADCSSAVASALCLGIGEAYLRRVSGRWVVQKVSAATF